MIERTGVVLRETVSVAEDETTLALDPQQTYFLVASETSLTILLLHFLGFQTQFFQSFLEFDFSSAKGCRGTARLSLNLFLLFFLVDHPEYEELYL